MLFNKIVPLCAAAVVLCGCGRSDGDAQNPELVPRGTQLTKVTPTRQDLATTVSLAGTVTANPTYGLVAPVEGQVRFAEEVKSGEQLRAAAVWAGGKAHNVDLPAGAVFAGRLVDDKTTVTAGMPIASAKHNGYGIVADLDAAQAYQVSGALTDVRAQVVNGPGPFPCAVLGSIAALPAGTAPPPPATTPPDQPTRQRDEPAGREESTSGPTGLRVTCTAPAGVTLINGAAAKLELVTGRSANALVVPVEAVAGNRERGKVDVLAPDGSRRTTDVALGLTDGKVVEVVSGLAGDEELAVPGPDLADPTTGAGR
ncbi:efflux RND transporter periplasmic adaptor subunit [Actinosynnema sp. NPDC047251]|uniref:efflux RND transporter periplasmic adaptor subunit n=1 Tax=Saccharothrix espanaensis TaxID=103731 RepID=UPI000318BCC0|nr:efflux RND transporter periplasmic adaptor subunit [Saccharothrix espanaensis]